MLFLKYVLLCHSLVLWINVKCITVRIQNGLVRGYVNKTVGQRYDYAAFRGIPYSEPPIKKLRFEPPVRKVNWNGTLDATKDGNMCVQGNPPVGSEDCLFINVYVPRVKISKLNLLPTMVFIYGGAFEAGSSNYATYGPDYLLEKNVIVVTFNYRVGIFGFLSTGDLVAPGNNGMKDQVLALEWVRDNIKYFGGDSNKVTIFGESAGAASVSYHMQSPQSRDLFRAAIMESGVSLCSWALSRQIPKTIKTIARNLSVNTTNSEQLVYGLKQIDYNLLQSVSYNIAIFQYVENDLRHGLSYGPVVEPEHDNAFFTTKSHEFLRNGGVLRVPCIVGFNSFEFVSFLDSSFSPLLYTYMQQYSINVTKFIPIDLNVNEDKANAAAVAIKKKYFGEGLVSDSPLQFIKFLSDDLFVRPVVEFARQVARFIPTYFYIFSYEGDLGGFVNRTYPGVGHAEELPYIWKTNIILSQADSVIRDKMVSMWTNFAKYSVPDGTKWKKFVNKSQNYLDIGETLRLKHSPRESDMIFWIDRIYQFYGNPPYDTF